MAIDNTSDRINSRTDRFAAGILALAGGLAMILLPMIHLIARPEQAGPIVGLHLLWVLLGGVVAVAGFFLIRGREKALWVLLVFWLLVALGGVLQAFGWMLWGSAPMMPAALAPAAAVLVILKIAIGTIESVLLVRCTPPTTRQRYGAMVAVNVAVTAAVVVVINMVAFYSPVQKDLQTLGRFGLSQRSRRIINDIEQPMTISAVYPAARREADTPTEQTEKERYSKQLTRVMELLEEVQNTNPKIKVVNASSDAGRSLLLERLRARQSADTADHEAMLNDILARMDSIVQAVRQQQQRWSKVPADSFLAQWDLGGALSDLFDRTASRLETETAKVRQTLATTPLPDYVQLLETMTQQLNTTQAALDVQASMLRKLAQIPQAVKDNAPGVEDALAQAIQAVRKVRQDVVNADTDQPADALKTLTTDLGQAAEQIRQVATTLDTIAGDDPEIIEMVSVSKAWMIEANTNLGRVRTTRSRLLEAFADQLDALRAQTAVQLSDANQQAQQRYLNDLRQPADQLVEAIDQTAGQVREGLAQLQQVDEFSKQVFKQADDEMLFKDLRDIIAPLIEQAEMIEKPEKAPLPEGLSDENILVIESGKDVEVISYNEVWPAMMEDDPYLGSGETPRFFNGDAALASQLLSMTTDRPFARVLMTYLKPPTPQRPNPMMPRPPTSDIPPDQLTQLRDQLTAANFRVQDWNLSGPLPVDPEPAGDDGATTQAAPAEPLPTILLVLPNAPSIPGMPGMGQPYGPAHVAKISEAIDNGATAIFLTSCMLPRQMGFGRPMPQQYALRPYLLDQWGIDVRAGYLVVEGLPTSQADKYRIDPAKLQYMPLNNFTDQPIGKPLRGRHVAWPLICPVSYRDLPRPDHVTVQPLLTIPDTMTNVWATDDVLRLIREAHNNPDNLVSPHYDAGDLRVPLTVAVAAARGAAPAADTQPETAPAKPTRIVVLGVGSGLLDWYLTSPIRVQDEGGFHTIDPPRANADLVVNSAYWLVGLENYIAAGPVAIEPVDDLSKTTRNVLWVLCVIVLPLAVLVGGSIVLIMRRRT